MPAKYTRAAIALHWLIAALIIVNVALGWLANWVADDAVSSVINLHESIGITVLGLAIMRVLWRATHRPPPLPSTYPAWEKRGAHAAHWLLYILIFALPLSGWVFDSSWEGAPSNPTYLFGVVPWPHIWFLETIDPAHKAHDHDLLGQVHFAFGYALYVLFALHVVGALKHQFVDREPEIQRMLP